MDKSEKNYNIRKLFTVDYSGGFVSFISYISFIISNLIIFYIFQLFFLWKPIELLLFFIIGLILSTMLIKTNLLIDLFKSKKRNKSTSVVSKN